VGCFPDRAVADDGIRRLVYGLRTIFSEKPLHIFPDHALSRIDLPRPP
jgi:hypothetical protein